MREPVQCAQDDGTLLRVGQVEVGPAHGQYAFCTSEPDLGENVQAKSIQAIIRAQSKYSALDRCSIMPFGVSGRTTYVIAGI